MDGSGERAVVQEVFSHGTLYEYFRLRAFTYSGRCISTLVVLMKRRTDHVIVVLSPFLDWKNSAPNGGVEFPPGGHKDIGCCWSGFGTRRWSKWRECPVRYLSPLADRRKTLSQKSILNSCHQLVNDNLRGLLFIKCLIVWLWPMFSGWEMYSWKQPKKAT